MKRFFGKYVGLNFSSDSELGLGEFEVTISERKISSRLATGNGIQTESIATAGFRPLSDAEIGEDAQKSPEDAHLSVAGFRHQTGNPSLYFLTDAEKGIRALFVVTGGLAGFLDPIPLLDEAGVAQGELDKLIALAEGSDKGMLPRLANGGRAPGSNKPD